MNFNRLKEGIKLNRKNPKNQYDDRNHIVYQMHLELCPIELPSLWMTKSYRKIPFTTLTPISFPDQIFQINSNWKNKFSNEERKKIFKKVEKDMEMLGILKRRMEWWEVHRKREMKDRTIKGIFEGRIEGCKERIRLLMIGLEEMIDQLA